MRLSTCRFSRLGRMEPSRGCGFLFAACRPLEPSVGAGTRFCDVPVNLLLGGHGVVLELAGLHMEWFRLERWKGRVCPSEPSRRDVSKVNISLS